MTEPANLSEAFRDRTEALDALGRAVVVKNETAGRLMKDGLAPGADFKNINLAWAAAVSEFHDVEDAYYEAHKTVQKFLNGDSE